ncbi:MAG: hypothetical protein JST26_14615 [Bacteroidetes bacterium]|nr:hypothetical protein [Bacteroidota bacterium]
MAIIVHLGLCYAMKIVSNRKHELTIQLNHFKAKKNVKILFMGDSHTERSIDESQIDSSFMLGYYGENNMMNYYKLKYCLEHGYPVPKYALFPCDIITFAKGFYRFRTNKFFYYRFIPVSDLSGLDDNPASMYYDYAKTGIFPYNEWQYALNRVNMDRQKKSKEKFSARPPEQRRKMAEHFVVDELMQGGDAAGLFDPKSIEFLKRTLVLCKQYHIKPVYLKFPLSDEVFVELRNHIDSSFMNHRPSEEILKAEGIPVLDFEYMFAGQPDKFFDSHHLNQQGRNQFTPVLKRSLDSLMLVY